MEPLFGSPSVHMEPEDSINTSAEPRGRPVLHRHALAFVFALFVRVWADVQYVYCVSLLAVSPPQRSGTPFAKRLLNDERPSEQPPGKDVPTQSYIEGDGNKESEKNQKECDC